MDLLGLLGPAVAKPVVVIFAACKSWCLFDGSSFRCLQSTAAFRHWGIWYLLPYWGVTGSEAMIGGLHSFLIDKLFVLT